MIGVIERVYWFFSAHPKRQEASQKSIDETQPDSNVHKLKDLCHTRWIQRPDALSLFQSLHPSAVACIEKISGGDNVQDWSTYSVTDARTLLLAINTTDFLSALVITNSGLSYIQPLAEAQDIVEAVKEISSVTTTLRDVRKSIDVHHTK